MKIILKLFFTLAIFYSSSTFASEKIFYVVTNEPSSDKRAIAFVDTVTGKNRILEVNMNGEVIWEWDFPDKLVSRTSTICSAADINYLQSTDEFLFILPKYGAFIIGRDGKYKSVVKDNKITHDIDVLPNGNFIYVRGFVNKGEDEVREVSPSGEIVWRWSHAKYFANRDDFSKIYKKKELRHLYKSGKLKRNNIDWAHVNGVERFDNGDTLISIRNFNMFVIVDPKGKPKKIFKDIHRVHEPHRTKFGYIAADRFRKAKKILHRVVLISNEEKRKYLLTGKFTTIRSIEQLKEDRFNITSVGNIFEIDVDANIFHRMHLIIDKEDGERDLTNKDFKKRKKLGKGRCAKGGNLYKVVKTK